MVTQDEYGNVYYNDPYVPSRSMSFSAQQFEKAKPKKAGPYIENPPPSNPKTDNKPDLLSRLKEHYDQFTSDPFAWATANPWKAAGGMGALTATIAGLSGNNQNNGNNSNNSGGFNFINGIFPGLAIAGLTYGAIKGIPWLKQQFKSVDQFKHKVNKLVDEANTKMQDAKVLEDKVKHSKVGKLMFGKPSRNPILRDSKGNLHTTGREVIYDDTKGHYVYKDTRKRV